MPPRPETVADMEQYKVSDKVGVTDGIILKEQYMIMVWGYALAACESETFPGAALHHWFAGDVARYRALYNALFGPKWMFFSTRYGRPILLGLLIYNFFRLCGSPAKCTSIPPVDRTTIPPRLAINIPSAGLYFLYRCLRK